jgi:ferredoxin-NADP reductase
MTGPARPASFTRCSADLARGKAAGEIDAYTCGPTPMIDAVMPVLQMAGVARAALFRQVHPGGALTALAGLADSKFR